MIGCIVAGATAWGAGVLFFAGPGGARARGVLAAIFTVVGLGAVVTLFVRQWRRRGILLVACALALVAGWWGTIRPSNDRDWQPEVAVLPHATFRGDVVTVHGVRNFDYRTETDFTPRYDHRTFDLRQLDRVDLVAVYWMGPAIAHVFLTFGFGNDHLAISIEARKERGEGYSSLGGFFRQYELVYIVADERDVIRLRTNYRKDPPEDVYLFRIHAPIENGRQVFLDYMRAINDLREQPRFYNTLTTNCTNVILVHSHANPDHLPLSWKILLSGYAPAYVYEAGRLDRSLAFEELKARSHGKARGSREYGLAAAIYAYAFLFPEGAGDAPRRFDPRFRIAAEIYNWTLAAAFRSENGPDVVLRDGSFALPFGKIDVAFDPAQLRAGDRQLDRFTSTGDLEVRGLAMRYRWPGLGAPLAASTRPIDAPHPGRDMVAPRLQVPVTAVLRIPEARRALVQGAPLTGRLELHLVWDTESVSIAGERVPLEAEPSAALALTFTGMPILEVETLGFLGRLSGHLADRLPLISATPYKPGLIPVVFVHGTQSSVVRWSEMYNRLLADPDIRGRYQFWFFQYDSGNPIVLSALRLREALGAAVARVDPHGRDPALRRMVLIGHSQGGLLVKMQVIDSGDRFWKAASRKPFTEVRLADETRDLLQRAMFVEPLPEVSRVVFISTPHRGSYVAGRHLVADLVRRLWSLPFSLAGLATDIARNAAAMEAGTSAVVPSAVDNMSPRHRFIRTLQEIPVVPSVTVNSIIAVKGDGPVAQGNDGVVEYASARIEPVESELVVKSSHSTQGNPHTIQEVRRILRLHVGLKTGIVAPPAR